MQYEIISDVFCNKKKNGERILIDKSGSKVKVISDKDHVVIVENGKGERYSTNKNNIKTIN